MHDPRDAEGRVIPGDSPQAYQDARMGLRQTRLGKLLRDTGIDELPELLNVISGRMSIVGPRPLLVEYRDRYSVRQMRRHEVRPGITGWAQIHGRQAVSYSERFELDVWYVDHISFRLDMKVLAFTLRELIVQRGTSEPGYATGTEFMGA